MDIGNVTDEVRQSAELTISAGLPKELIYRAIRNWELHDVDGVLLFLERVRVMFMKDLYTPTDIVKVVSIGVAAEKAAIAALHGYDGDDYWRCINCHRINDLRANQCAACLAEKPDFVWRYEYKRHG